jgi:hypothetical protein
MFVSGEMVVARKKMEIFTYGMIDQLHKGLILGPPVWQPVTLVFLKTLRRQNCIHIHFLHSSITQNSTALRNRSLTGILVFLGARNSRGGYYYIHAHMSGPQSGISIFGRS